MVVSEETQIEPFWSLGPNSNHHPYLLENWQTAWRDYVYGDLCLLQTVHKHLRRVDITIAVMITLTSSSLQKALELTFRRRLNSGKGSCWLVSAPQIWFPDPLSCDLGRSQPLAGSVFCNVNVLTSSACRESGPWEGQWLGQDQGGRGRAYLFLDTARVIFIWGGGDRRFGPPGKAQGSHDNPFPSKPPFLGGVPRALNFDPWQEKNFQVLLQAHPCPWTGARAVAGGKESKMSLGVLLAT